MTPLCPSAARLRCVSCCIMSWACAFEIIVWRSFCAGDGGEWCITTAWVCIWLVARLACTSAIAAAFAPAEFGCCGIDCACESSVPTGEAPWTDCRTDRPAATEEPDEDGAGELEGVWREGLEVPSLRRRDLSEMITNPTQKIRATHISE